MSTQFGKHINRSTDAERLNNPPNVDETHRKQAYPDVCTPTCEHVTCGYRTVENEGRPCFMKFSQYKTKPNDLVEPFGMQRQIDEIVKKGFEQFEKRLRKIENEPEHHAVQRSINVNGQKRHAYTPKLVFSETLRIDRDRNKN